MGGTIALGIFLAIAVIIIVCLAISNHNSSDAASSLRQDKKSLIQQLDAMRKANTSLRNRYGNPLTEQQIEDLQSHFNELAAQFNTKQQEFNELSARNNEAIATKEVLCAQLSALNYQVTQLNSKIIELSATHSAMVRITEEDFNMCDLGFVPTLDPAARTTLDLINQLLGSTNDNGLREALLKWVWERAYRPVFQRELKRLDFWDARNCIYRLELVDDPDVCYVGQAVSLKERWYEHAKSMIFGSSTSRLYAYQPNQFCWTLIEQNLDPASLNEHESAWIDFYAADCVGLNSKG